MYTDVFDKTKKCFRKQISKDKADQTHLTHEAIKAYCHKETDKTFTQVDFYGMLIDIEKNVPFTDISDYEKASYQQTIMKHIDIKTRNIKELLLWQMSIQNIHQRLAVMLWQTGTFLNVRLAKNCSGSFH